VGGQNRSGVVVTWALGSEGSVRSTRALALGLGLGTGPSPDQPKGFVDRDLVYYGPGLSGGSSGTSTMVRSGHRPTHHLF